MSKVLERLRKRRCQKVPIDGEDYYLRAMTIGEFRRSDALTASGNADARTGFIIGCILCQGEDGTQEIPKGDDEDDLTWAKRVLFELTDVPDTTVAAIIKGLSTVGKTASMEAIVKNL